MPAWSSSGPCASRVAKDDWSGARSATRRRPARTSSGRTVGVPCRTTTVSIAHGGSEYSPTTASRTTRRRASRVLTPAFVGRSTSTDDTSKNARMAVDTAPGAVVGSRIPLRGRHPVGERAGPRLDDVENVQPRRQCGVECVSHHSRVTARGHRDLQVLGLGRRPGRCRPHIRDSRVRNTSPCGARVNAGSSRPEEVDASLSSTQPWAYRRLIIDVRGNAPCRLHSTTTPWPG